MEWNGDDFQGRTKEQIERNYKVFGILLRFTVLIGFGITIYAIIKDFI